MIRRVMSIASVISFMLFVATVVLWVRSYWIADAVNWSFGLHRKDVNQVVRVQEVLFDSGTVSILITELPADSEEVNGSLRWNRLELGSLERTPRDNLWHRLNFEASRGKLPMGQSELVETLIRLPTWSFVLLSGVLPALWLPPWWARHLERRRRRARQCVRCGYNLTGNASGVCPECGTPIPQAARSSASDDKSPTPA